MKLFLLGLILIGNAAAFASDECATAVFVNDEVVTDATQAIPQFLQDEKYFTGILMPKNMEDARSTKTPVTIIRSAVTKKGIRASCKIYVGVFTWSEDGTSAGKYAVEATYNFVSLIKKDKMKCEKKVLQQIAKMPSCPNLNL